jgi:hypothetical protein
MKIFGAFLSLFFSLRSSLFHLLCLFKHLHHTRTRTTKPNSGTRQGFEPRKYCTTNTLITGPQRAAVQRYFGTSSLRNNCYCAARIPEVTMRAHHRSVNATTCCCLQFPVGQCQCGRVSWFCFRKCISSKIISAVLFTKV